MKKFKILTVILALILSLGLLAGCGKGGSDSQTGGNTPAADSSAAKENDAQKESSAPAEGDAQTGGDKISAKVVLVLEDKTEVPYDISVTPGQTLRDALNEAGLLTEESYYSMFVDDIDGHVADALNDGVTWLPCDKDGNQLEKEIEDESAVSTFDMLQVDDGDEFYLVYTVVPNYD